MISIFTIPKPFTNRDINLIQDNAIRSWLALVPRPEVFLLGHDKGVIDRARRFKTKYLPDVVYNEFGTPLLNSAFSLVSQKAKHEILMFVNADIVLPKNLVTVLEKVPGGRFLMVGQRLDVVDINQWQAGVRLHPPGGSDFFIFRRGTFTNLPAFAVGRIGWDNWMIYEARRQKIPVIDVSKIFLAIHQNHDYRHYRGPGRDVWHGPEARRNFEFLGGKGRDFGLEDADWYLDGAGLHKKLLILDLRLVYKYLRYCPEVL